MRTASSSLEPTETCPSRPVATSHPRASARRAQRPPRYRPRSWKTTRVIPPPPTVTAPTCAPTATTRVSRLCAKPAPPPPILPSTDIPVHLHNQRGDPALRSHTRASKGILYFDNCHTIQSCQIFYYFYAGARVKCPR